MHSLISDDIGASRPSANELGWNEPANQESPAVGPPEPVAAVARDYRPELPTPVLIAEVRSLLISERRAGRLVCRYLADLADRLRQRRDGDPLAHIDELQATASIFNLGAKDTRERVRVGRALRRLPQIEAAFVAGILCYSRVREVTRVARADTEHVWLDLARELDMRTLERRVSRSVKRASLTGEDLASDDLASDDLASDDLASDDLASERFDSEPFDGQPFDSEAFDGPPFDSEALEGQCLGSPSLDFEAFRPEAHESEPAELSRLDSTPLDAPSLDELSLDSDAHGVAHGSNRDSRATEDECGEPAFMPERAESHAPNVMRVTFELSPEALALLERALDNARRRARAPLTDAEALEAIARETLAAKDIGVELHHNAGDASSAASSNNRDTDCLLTSSGNDANRRPTANCEGTQRDLRMRGKASSGAANSDDGDELASQRTDSALPSGEPSSAASSDSSLERPRASAILSSALDSRRASKSAGETTSQVGASRSRLVRLLDILERRECWSLDHLLDVTGMGIPELQHALLLLELEGRIRRSSSWISPARAPNRSQRALHSPPAPDSPRARTSVAAPSLHPH